MDDLRDDCMNNYFIDHSNDSVKEKVLKKLFIEWAPPSSLLEYFKFLPKLGLIHTVICFAIGDIFVLKIISNILAYTTDVLIMAKNSLPQI